MRRHRIPVLLALTLGILSGCSAYPPKVSCERHLTPINLASSVSSWPAAATPARTALKTSKALQRASATHGR